ncbi:30S ribosomal protein S21 [Candidatus Falkowbacteria bacterium]|nr:30S ribosomal protein S21 [Candidatus Falkowbacteria bacterium]
MAIEVKRKKVETFESLLRRFNRRMIQSKLVLECKRKAHYKRPLSRNRQRANALSRKTYSEKRNYLRKTGRLPEEELTQKRRY